MTTRLSDMLENEMLGMGRAAKAAARQVAGSPAEQRNEALKAMATALRESSIDLLAANAKDLEAAKAKGLTDAMTNRLVLNDDRIEGMAKGLEDIAALDDPIERELDQWTRPNGMTIRKVAVPLGVVGVIYESRPNVTADAGGLCLKAGNAVILRGGSESFHSSQAIHACLQKGLQSVGLPESAIQIVPTRDRMAVGHMLKMADYIDVIVPRGGKSLVARVQEESRVPVFAHLDGICHVYIDKAAQADMATSVIRNAKLRRVEICGAAETVLCHADVADAILPDVMARLQEEGCEVRGDSRARLLGKGIETASEDDWTTEYLAPVISVKVVQDMADAIDHINTHGSHHTDCIITDDRTTADHFQRHVDSAIVMHNVSTQFADGGEFGMGAEIGISTGRMHARGPVGVDQLTTFHYRVSGDGLIRA